MTPDRDRLRRLRAARATGLVPPDLVPWLLDLAEAASVTGTDGDDRSTPGERLADTLGDEIDRWMVRRRVTHRTIGVSRRTLSRALRGENVTLATVAEIADALGCDATIRFDGRGASAPPAALDGPTPPAPANIKVEAEYSCEETTIRTKK